MVHSFLSHNQQYMKDLQYQERIEFLQTYAEFCKWLTSIGFRVGHWRESCTAEDILYTHYSEHINSLYGVEHYVHDVLDFSMRFIRDKHEHKFMFVAWFGSYSNVYSIVQMKQLILSKVCELRDMKISKLNELKNIQ